MRGANQHKQTPGGLLLPVSATLKGRVRWQVLDERGLPEVPRSPSGFALAPAEGVEQPNLITDLGLDQIATFDCFAVDPTRNDTWRRYLAVGTGSTTPTNGDTTLAAEVQRAASSGSFPNGAATYELDDVADVFRAHSLVTRVVTMNADRNIAEFGLSPESSGAIGIRELLRDGEGNPITVSLLTGKSLRVDHTLVVEIPAPEAGTPATININEYDAGNNLVASTPYDVTYGPYWSGSTSSLQYIYRLWNPTVETATSARRLSAPYTYNRDAGVPGGSDYNLVLQTYIPGSHQRLKRVTIAAGNENGAWYGYATRANITGYGFVVSFNNPATYTKVNTDTLRVGFVSTWARAA